MPINQLKEAITDLANGKEVLHPSIGVEMMPVTPTLAAQLNQQAARQRTQQQVERQQEKAKQREKQQQAEGKEKGGAGEEGRREGGGSPLSQFLRKAQQVGEHLLHQQQGPRPPSSSSSSTSPSEKAAATTPEEQIHYIPEGGAVVVVNVLEESPAQLAGLRNLDILLEIDRCPIYSVEDAQRIIHASGVGKDLEVKVLRSTQEVTLRVQTTDFLTLFRKQQTARKYPELKRKVPVGGGGGGGEGELGRQATPTPHQRSASDEATRRERKAEEEAAKVEGKQEKEEEKKDEVRGELWM